MTQIQTHEEPDLEAWLDNARAGLAPREADRARVLAALEKRLALPAATQQPCDTQHSESLKPAAVSGAAAGGMLARWAWRALLPVAAVGAAALFATQLRVSAPTPTLRAAKPAAALLIETETETETELATDSDARELVPADQGDNQSDKSPAQKKKKPQRKKCRAANGQEQPCEIKAPASETALAAAKPAATSLSRELEALRQAQHALRSGQAARALAVLEAFEREANGAGEMQEERAAAATVARCALAQTEQDKDGLFSEFVSRYPKSAYAARLRRSCQAQP